MQTYNVQSEFQGDYQRKRTSTRYLVVHHAAAQYASAKGIDDVRAVDRYHKGKGWGGIGYHIALAEETQDGPIARYILSDPSLSRAGVAHRNHETLHVSCLTNFGSKRPAQKWIDTLAITLRDLLVQYPNAEIVGHKEIALTARQSPDGNDWSTACPGATWAMWKLNLLAVAHNAPLLGSAGGTVAQAVTWLATRAHSSYADAAIEEMVEAYATLGSAVGLDWFLALAQLAHETGNLTAFWSLRPQRNPAGIGVTGQRSVTAVTDPEWAYNSQRAQWERGISFPTWAQHAIPAHLGRVLAYALTDAQATDAQRKLIAGALSIRPIPARWRGVAPLLMDLNGRWAVPGTGYGQRLAQLAQRMRRGIEEAP